MSWIKHVTTPTDPEVIEAYQDRDYEGSPLEMRTAYLKDLAEETGADDDMMTALLCTLPDTEDFDGMFTMLEDFTGRF